MLRPNELLIGDHSPASHHAPPPGRTMGLVPRDYSIDPPTMFSPPTDIILVPRSEWPERLKDKVANHSLLSDIRLAGNAGQPIPSLDQDGVGYCWAHSTTHAVILQRAVANQPYVPLSAFAVAATIKHGADEGGWCGLSAKFAREKGIPSQKLWPQGDRNYRTHDTPEVWADAALHRITEDWVDLTVDVYDQNLTFDMLGSLLMSNVCGPADFNFWSHSVCALDIVDGNTQRDVTRAESGKLMSLQEFELAWGINHPVTGGFGLRIWNSWSDSWSDRGMGVLTGSKAVPDGALAVRTTPAG